jgi:hypothetical protein
VIDVDHRPSRAGERYGVVVGSDGGVPLDPVAPVVGVPLDPVVPVGPLDPVAPVDPVDPVVSVAPVGPVLVVGAARTGAVVGVPVPPVVPAATGGAAGEDVTVPLVSVGELSTVGSVCVWVRPGSVDVVVVVVEALFVVVAAAGVTGGLATDASSVVFSAVAFLCVAAVLFFFAPAGLSECCLIAFDLIGATPPDEGAVAT